MMVRFGGVLMRQAIIALAVTVALAGAWIGLLLNAPPRQVETVAAVKADAAIAEYLRYRSEGHLVGRYH